MNDQHQFDKQIEFAKTPDMSESLFLSSKQTHLPDGLQPATLEIFDGKIVQVISGLQKNSKLIQGILAPGFVDTHAHINEPGRTEWEGFNTATQAALAGGVTTVIDMPLNSLPPTTSLRHLETKETSALNQCWINYGFWGGVVPQNSNLPNELKMMVDAGVKGFKAFMIDSGVPEFEFCNSDHLRQAMTHLAKLDVPLLVHAEVDLGQPSAHSNLPQPYSHFLESRPRSFENEAIRRILELASQTHCAVHIVHLSSAEALSSIQKARLEGVRVTVETCPHYLALCSEDIAQGATHFKCCPPIREEKNRLMLIEGLKNGTIDMIVSDHSPCTPQLKLLEKGDFDKAWGGIASLQLSFAVVWTALQKHGFNFEQVHRLMSTRPARFAKLLTKGSIAPGMDADLIEIDLDSTTHVTPQMLLFKNKVTPYMNQTLQSRIKRTWIAGELKFEDQKLVGSPNGKKL